MKEKECIWDQEICFNNAKIQTVFHLKYVVLGDLYTFTMWAVQEKKKSSAFPYSGYSLKYSIKYKDKIYVTFTSARFEINI